MKKTIIALFIGVAPVIANAQTKKDTTKYEKFFKVNPNDLGNLLQIVNDYRRLAIYDPNTDDKSKISLQKQIDAYIKELNGKLKIDSVKVINK